MFQFKFHNIDRLDFFPWFEASSVMFEHFLFLANKLSVKFFWRIKTLWALLDVILYFLCSNYSRHSRWEMVRFTILKDSQLSIWSCCKNSSNSSSSLENVHSFGTATFSIFKNSKGKLHALLETELLIIELSILLVIFESCPLLAVDGKEWVNLMGSLHIFRLHISLFLVECNDLNQFFYQCSWCEASFFLVFA